MSSRNSDDRKRNRERDINRKNEERSRYDKDYEREREHSRYSSYQNSNDRDRERISSSSSFQPEKYISHEPSKSILLRGLLPSTTKETIEYILGGYGITYDIRVPKDRSSDLKKGRGYAFVEFSNLNFAQDFMHNTGGSVTIDDTLVTLDWAKPYEHQTKENSKPGSSNSSSSLFYDWLCPWCSKTNYAKRNYCFSCNNIKPENPQQTVVVPPSVRLTPVLLFKGFPPQTTETDVGNLVSPFQIPVKDIRLPKDKFTGFAKGFAFVEFNSVSDAREIYDKTRNITMKGNPIKISLYKEQSQSKDVQSYMDQTYSWEENNTTNLNFEKTPFNVEDFINNPDNKNKFSLDSRSGFFFEPTNGIYYDPKEGCYWDPSTGTYYYQNSEEKNSKFLAIFSDDPRMEKHRPQSSENIQQREAAAFLEALEKEKKEKLKENMNVASGPVKFSLGLKNTGKKKKLSEKEKKVQLSLSKWKEVRTNDNPESISNENSKNEVQNNLEVQPSPQVIQNTPSSSFSNFEFPQTLGNVCLICKRKFEKLKTLEKHLRKSELHKHNIEVLEMKKKFQKTTHQRELREKNEFKASLLMQSEINTLNFAPVQIINSTEQTEKEKIEEKSESQFTVGKNLMEKMGWRGQGIGKDEKITELIHPVPQQERKGLNK